MKSKTKIKLEWTYSDRWRAGYLIINRDDRRTLILYNSPKERSSTQYARYLLAVSLGRFLEDDEQVDHIDDDKTNDDISNLAVISQEGNLKKAGLAKRKNVHGTLTISVHCKCSLCLECKREYTRKMRLKAKERS